jgi:glycine/D-amino acid oxidase-like deaminating enzyme
MIIGPVVNPTESWWLRDLPASSSSVVVPRSPTATATLPEHADIVVIGAGMTGASVAYWLSEKHNLSCLVLDARGVACGASGRNGGHLWPNQTSDFEGETVRSLLDFIEERDVDCDLTRLGAVDLADAPPEDDDGDDDDDDWGHLEEWDEGTCATRLCTNAFAWAQYHPDAFQFSAARVTSAIFDAAGTHATLCAPVRVLRISNDAVGGRGSIVDTDVGSVTANRVVVATNGWTGELLPELSDVLYPCRNQVIMTSPSEVPAGWCVGAFSVGAATGHGDIEEEIYCIKRPDGRLCVGGARYLEHDAAVGNSDDGTLNEDVGRRLREFLVTSFPDLAPLSVEAEWTGVIGLTADRKPLVGRMPSRTGVFVAAGYNGHGMPQCFGVGRYMADMLAGGAEEELHPHIRTLSPARFFRKETISA